MKERPILFNRQMVRAILDGTKTQTRRVIKPQNLIDWSDSMGLVWNAGGEKPGPPIAYLDDFDLCAFEQNPYGQPGDQLWVRETFGLLWRRETAFGDEFDEYTEKLSDIDRKLLSRVFRADDDFEPVSSNFWRPSIHMPRWASRMQLKIISVRVERLQDITEEDAKREGIKGFTIQAGTPNSSLPRTIYPAFPEKEGGFHSAKYAFEVLWDSINARRKDKHGKILPYAWKDNPWVWVIEFERIKP